MSTPKAPQLWSDLSSVDLRVILGILERTYQPPILRSVEDTRDELLVRLGSYRVVSDVRSALAATESKERSK